MTIELGAGLGVVAAIGDAALFVAASETAAPLVEPLVEAMRRSVADGGASGRPLARQLATLLLRDDLGPLPAFGAFAALDDGWVVVLHGAVRASVTTGAGDEETISGSSATTWTDRILPADVATVLIGPVELAAPGATPLRLESGVVPGGWLRVVLATGGPPRERPRAEFELFSLSPDGLEPRDPLPIEGVETPPDDEAVDDDQVVAGEVVDDDDRRVSLGLLVFDDGSAFGLDDDYVLGREPENDQAVIAGTARPIALDDPADTVSRVHAEIRVGTDEVRLIDRGSTNGTHLWDESNAMWRQLTPGEPHVMRAGEHGAVGRRTFVYEAVYETVGPVLGPTEPRSAPETIAVARPVGSLVGEGGDVYPLDRSYVIGREPLADGDVARAAASPIVVRDDHVSRVHARVGVTGGAVMVSDAGTTGGTFIAAPGAPEWEAIGPEPTELPPGWSLRVGTHVFTFRDER